MFLGRRRLLKHGYFSLVLCPTYGPSIGAPWIQLGTFSILALRLSTLEKPRYITRGNCDISQDIHNQSTEPFRQSHQSVHPTSLLEDRPKFPSEEITNAPAHEPEELNETRTLQARSLVDGKSQSVSTSRHATSIDPPGRERKKRRGGKKYDSLRRCRWLKKSMRFQARRGLWQHRTDNRSLRRRRTYRRAFRSQHEKRSLVTRSETDKQLNARADWTRRFERLWAIRSPSFPSDSPFSLENVDYKEDGMAIWQGLQAKDRQKFWRPALYNFMLFQPWNAVTMIADTLENPNVKLSKWLAMESLCLIILRLFESSTRQPDVLVEKVLDTFKRALEMYERGPRGSESFPYATFAFAKHLDLEQLTTLWTSLSRRPEYLNYKTTMKLVYMFAQFGDAKTGLEVLGTIHPANISDLRTQYALIKLLRMDLHVENPYDFQLKALNRFLEGGLQPSIHVQNMAILNAMEACDNQTAWAVYDLMRENGMRPNALTYRILLIGASDREMVTDVYRKAIQDGIDTTHPPTATRFFMAWAKALNPEGKVDTFEDLLPYYTATFDAGPLRELGMLLGSSYEEDPDNPKQTPTIEVVGIMIIHFLRYEKFYVNADTVYRNYLRLVGERHPIVAPLAHNTATSDAFLMCFGRSTLHLPTCVSIIADMTNPAESPAPQPRYDGPLAKALGKKWYNPPTDDFYVAPPSVYTWSIMLYNFFRHQRLDAAEKVVQLMQTNGLTPTRVTWTTLLQGYALMQDQRKVMKTLDEMKEAGFEHDEWTVRAMSHLENKKALLEYLDKNGNGTPEEWKDGEEHYSEEMEEILDGDSGPWEGEGDRERNDVDNKRRGVVDEYLYGGDLGMRTSGKKDS